MEKANLSDSPIHLLTRSDELTLKKVLFASVATAFARYDFPVPGGPYSRIPRHGVRLPVKRWGNLIGKITASLRESLAPSKPATSSHFTLGLSVRIAPEDRSGFNQHFRSGPWLVSQTMNAYLTAQHAASSALDRPHLHPC